MAFRELQAMQVAYDLLSPLEPSAQQRVMAWLSAALADADSVALAVDDPAVPGMPVADEPEETASPDSVTDGAAQPERAVSALATAAPPAPAVEPVAAAEPQAAVEPEPEPGPVAEPAPTPRPKRGRSAQAPGRRAAKATRASVTATPAPTAPGRRGERPSGEQFLADLTAAGSFKALAKNYGKSIGTIGNWANQLREQGFDIPVGRQKKV
uniref:hypothetical protein n=1 Tax=Paractinoplanes polyasparticus TaxID=2856853 RepID=UPI001C84C30A|nr:hypothetical protein [Actinoplanes polyasparticus]